MKKATVCLIAPTSKGSPQFAKPWHLLAACPGTTLKMAAVSPLLYTQEASKLLMPQLAALHLGASLLF